MLALANAAIALGVIVIVGRVVMRPLFRLVASVGMSDLFVATTLFVIVAAGVAAAVAGFSMALGAFVAGLLLAETEFRKAIETAIDPFKGLLLGLFFFTVGMNIDFRELARDPRLADRGRRRTRCREIHHPHRPRPAVSPFLAGVDRSRASCSARAASSPSSASAWRQRSV